MCLDKTSFALKKNTSQLYMGQEHTPSKVTIIRAPLQPIGWPRETAPPLKFSFS